MALRGAGNKSACGIVGGMNFKATKKAFKETLESLAFINGDPNEVRTRVTGVRGRFIRTPQCIFKEL